EVVKWTFDLEVVCLFLADVLERLDADQLGDVELVPGDSGPFLPFGFHGWPPQAFDELQLPSLNLAMAIAAQGRQIRFVARASDVCPDGNNMVRVQFAGALPTELTRPSVPLVDPARTLGGPPPDGLALGGDATLPKVGCRARSRAAIGFT